VATGALSALLRIVCEFLLPPLCDSCRSRLPSHLRWLCPACSARLRDLEVDDPVLRQSRLLLTSSGNISLFVALYRFEADGPLRTIIHGVKYQGLTRAGIRLGRVLGRRVRDECPHDIDAIVPVPLHPTRYRERGYNQAACIARGLARVLRVPVDEGILVRARSTVSQTSLGREERRANVRGAFSVPSSRRSAAEGRRFLIVDDVVTTGSTLQECAAALCSEGARRCVACAVAVAADGNV